MAEGARLESVCSRNTTEGSNPSLSAILSSSIPSFSTQIRGIAAAATGSPHSVVGLAFFSIKHMHLEV